MDKTKYSTLVLNLLGGPGCGKSTTAAEVFAKLKWMGVLAELAPEFAKDVVWDKSFHHLDDQIWLFGNQYRRINRLLGQVQVVITDSPLLLSLVYGSPKDVKFREFVRDVYDRMENLNFYLRRTKIYVESGRMQNKDRAIGIDNDVLAMLESESLPYTDLEAIPTTTANTIVACTMKRLGEMGEKIG